MDLKDMRLFLAIAEENNLTRAAQKNGYTQSAASHMLRNIETELGFSLFSRSQRGLALTRNGEALLSPIRRTLAAAEYFDQTAASIRGIQTGHIRIGAYLSASVQWLPLNPPMERVLGVRIPSAKKASPAASLLIAQLQRTVFELEGPLL